MTPICTPLKTELGFGPSAAPAKRAQGRDSRPMTGAAARVSFANSRLVNSVGNGWFERIIDNGLILVFRIWVQASGFMT
jgi:hypothetical protein